MKIYCIIIVLLFYGSGFSQKQDLGKVTVKELEEKLHSIDSSAVAAVLFKKAKTTFTYTLQDGFYSQTEFSVKIKIYKKEGLTWANYSIPYYVGYNELNDDYVEVLKAYSYNLVAGKVSETRVTSENKFVQKNNEFWKTKIISFPNVVVGSIIELKYKLKSHNLSVLPEFQYQYNIPVNYAEYKTEIPEFYIYKSMRTGYVEMKVEEKIKSSSASYLNKHGQSESMSFLEVNSSYAVSNVPALYDEEYVNNIDNYFAKIENELQVIRYPNQEPKQIATTWESVAKSIYADPEFGAELDKNKYFLSDLRNLIKETDSSSVRVSKVFEFVKNRMNWNGKYGYYTKNGVEKAYLEKTGNVAEINFILIAMLKMAGISTEPVLISTRDNGLALFPNRSKFNFVIAAANFDGNQILLDATSKISSIKVLPIRDLNSKGRLIYKNGSSQEIDLMPKQRSNNITYVLAEMDNAGKISANVREQYSDYKAYQYRNLYLNVDQESYVEKLEKHYNGLEISSYEIKNDKQLLEPIIENYSIINNNSVDIIGDKMYFSPLLHLLKTQNPFKLEQRLYPVDYMFPTMYKYVVNLKIPEGYVVENLPKSTSMKINEDYANFNYSITNKANQLTLNLTFNINQSIIPAEDYQNLKEFYKVMIDKETEKVVLRKI